MKKLFILLGIALCVSSAQAQNTNLVNGQIMVRSSNSPILQQSTNSLTLLDPIVIGQPYTNGLYRASLYWSVVFTTGGGVSECDLSSLTGSVTNKFGYASSSNATITVPACAPLQPNGIFLFNTNSLSGSISITNCFIKVE